MSNKKKRKAAQARHFQKEQRQENRRRDAQREERNRQWREEQARQEEQRRDEPPRNSSSDFSRLLAAMLRLYGPVFGIHEMAFRSIMFDPFEGVGGVEDLFRRMFPGWEEMMGSSHELISTSAVSSWTMIPTKSSASAEVPPWTRSSPHSAKESWTVIRTGWRICPKKKGNRKRKKRSD